MGGGRPAPGRGGRGGGRTGNLYGAAAAGRGGGMNQIDKAALEAEACKLEEDLGYENFTEGEDRLGWLMNIFSVRTACIHRLTHPSFVRPHPPSPYVAISRPFVLARRRTASTRAAIGACVEAGDVRGYSGTVYGKALCVPLADIGRGWGRV